MDITKLYISELLSEEELSSVISTFHVGLELINFSVSENLDNYDLTLQREKDLLITLGNPSVTIHGPFLDLNPMAFDRQIRKVTMHRFSQAWEAARELNASRIVYHSCMIPSVYFLQGWAERMADFWNEFLEAHSGIPVCMENVLDPEIYPFLDVAKRVDSTDFGICLDIGHANCYSKHPAEKWATELAPYIRHVHLHDNDKSYDQHLALGDGNIPWKKILELYQSNQNITYTIECSRREAVMKSLEQLKA